MNSLLKLLPEGLQRISLPDVLSSRSHSDDFSGSRAGYINTRIKFVASALAIVTPLWIIVDFLTLTGNALSYIVALRLICGLLFLDLALRSRPTVSINASRLRLAAVFLICGAFYVVARLILDGSLAREGLLAGYTYLPLAQAALLALFPVTLLEGALISSLIVGLVTLTDAYLGHLGTVETLGYIWILGLVLGMALMAEVSKLHMLLRLHRQATRDPLTGLFNRRALMQRFEEEVDRARRYKYPLSIVLFDLDRFKRINDEFGHLAGDAVLARFAEILTSGTRSSDTVGRYGGEEFLMVLPEAETGQAWEAAERIRLHCERERVATPGGERLQFSVSAGVAELKGCDDADCLFRRVDSSLYRAKAEGRNQVVIADVADVADVAGVPDVPAAEASAIS